MDALALNYLSYGLLTAVNRMLAAWLAAVTAAFSFWRMGPSSPPRPEQRGRCRDAATLLQLEEPAVESVSTDGRETNNNYCISALETTENSTKGRKFVLYYRNDDFREGGVVEAVHDDDEDDDGVSAEIGEKFRRWSDDVDWERKMEIRMGGRDMGWYRCQDLAAFNGSVVRFWDGCSRRPVCATTA
ncbi:uncharacterized protein [Henckelia pumila]|uniref:uncharacterized protein n=1 Tax=Henckelia pumila TaxID=405737 RepID=UPI003C6E5690